MIFEQKERILKQMKNSLPQLKDLNDEFLHEIMEQLQKDLQMSAWPKLNIKANNSPEELVELLAKLLQENHSLDNLLYRIDLNFVGVLQSFDDYKKLSLKIWDRILKKVWFRRLYSKKLDE